MGFDFDAGTMRFVFLIGRWAIKVAWGRLEWRLLLRGLLANLTERDIWHWSGAPSWEDFGVKRVHLARVFWCCPGGFFLIMERALRTSTESEYESMPNELLAGLADSKPDNIGFFPDGCFRAIDYGGEWTMVEAEIDRRRLIRNKTVGAVCIKCRAAGRNVSRCADEVLNRRKGPE